MADKNLEDLYKSIYEKKADKDYDGDGKVESGSKEHAGAVHNAIQRKKGLKPDGQDTRKEEVELDERYKGKHGQSDKEYADSRSQGGKMVSGDSKGSGAEYTHGRRVKAANPGMQPDVGGKTKPKSQGKMDAGTRADLKYRKANLKKEELENTGLFLDWEIDAILEVFNEGVRDEDPEKGTAERKARLEKKRGMKLDDHPQYKKEEVELDENRRAARSAGGYKDDSKKQTDPSKDGFTGIGNMSIDQIRKMSARIEKEKTKKEEVEIETIEEKKKGLWDNIHAKRKRGEAPAKPGDKDYPKTLNVEETETVEEGMKKARENVGASTCWDGYEAKGTKKKGGKEVPNCVKKEEVSWATRSKVEFSKPEVVEEEGISEEQIQELAPALAAALPALKGAAMRVAASQTARTAAKQVGKSAIKGAANKLSKKLNPEEEA
jgi:hypothetical protein